MKTLFICLLALSISSCQRFLTVSTREGLDVHVQGNRVSVIDSLENFRTYEVQDAYKTFNHYGDVYRLLKEVNDPGVAGVETPPMAIPRSTPRGQ